MILGGKQRLQRTIDTNRWQNRDATKKANTRTTESSALALGGLKLACKRNQKRGAGPRGS